MPPEQSATSLPAAESDLRTVVAITEAGTACAAAPGALSPGSADREAGALGPGSADREPRALSSDSTDRDPRAPRWPAAAAIAGPAALAAALIVPGLTSRSLSLDGAATATIIAQHGSALRAAIAHDGGNMAGYYALMHMWRAIAGTSPLALRLPSAVAGVITVALVGALARTLYGRRGLLAGVLMAVSLPLVFWSQSARGYAPMLMFITGSFLTLAGLLTRADARTRTNRGAALWAAAYAGLAAAGIYMGLTAALAVPVAVALLLWLPRRRSITLAVAVAAVAAACVPLAVLADSRGSGQIAWVSTITPRSLLQVLDALTSAGLPPNFRTSVATTVALVATSAALVVVIALLSARLWSAPRDPAAWRLALPLLWLLFPVVLVLAESVVGQPMLVSRNLLVALPAVPLLLGWGLAQAGGRWALAATVLLVAARAPGLAGAAGTSPENWQAATATVLARAQPGDCVAFYPADGRMAFRAYLRPDGAPQPPRAVLPALPWSVDPPLVEDYATLRPGTIAARCPRLWLVSAHTGQADRSATGRRTYGRFLILRARLAGAYVAATPARFGYAPAVQVQLFRRRPGAAGQTP